MKRREFIVLTGVGAASTTLLSGCGNPENALIPALIPDDTYTPGIDYWKASTCALCSAGCGILVRTRERAANKIEGNPLHPVNKGALCARGQAGLQVLYNPDRVKGPMKRSGERGSGQFESISWDEAAKILVDRLADIRAKNGQASVAFSLGNTSNVNRIAAEHFMSSFGSERFISAPVSSDHDDLLFNGTGQRAVFDIANATYLLSFGARFLETWQSPVMYSLAYGEFRRGKNRRRGKFVMIEPRMSTTAANADEWLPAAIGTEGLLALAIAQVIIREKLTPNPVSPNVANGTLDEFAPEKTEADINLPAEKIVRIAREFAASERPLAIAGGAAALGDGESIRAVHFLNKLVGNLNMPGGVFEVEQFDPLAKLGTGKPIKWAPLSEKDGYEGGGSALLIHGMNPVFHSPQMTDRINAFQFIVSFSPFIDETTQLADLILPDHSYLESWDIQAATAHHTVWHADLRALQPTPTPYAAIASPAISPEFDTKQTADVLIDVSRQLGQPLPFESSEECVRKAVSEVRRAFGQAAEISDEDWKSLLESGVMTGDSKPSGSTSGLESAKAGDQPLAISTGEPKPSNDAYPFFVLAYEHAALGYGDHANLPWLQELPDPLTSVLWGSWVEINPKTAASLHIEDGDLVEVKTADGSLRLPAVLFPAIRPDVIAMPYGQGHTAYGQYAKGRGVNPATIAGPYWDAKKRFGVRASVAKAAGEAKLVRFGTSLPEKIDTPR
ncbi:MAG: nitrate reductase [Blastocatellia bacterium AA13]|nr:MAG: nitrate reductase [Blastocatellia bacterium AA13]